MRKFNTWDTEFGKAIYINSTVRKDKFIKKYEIHSWLQIIDKWDTFLNSKIDKLIKLQNLWIDVPKEKNNWRNSTHPASSTPG